MNDLGAAPDLQAQTDALQAELRKLRRINDVLMERVERSTDMSSNAFSMFETAIALEAKVRDRTLQLEDALRRLALANTALADAHAQANAAQMRLRDAIESINEGFVLFDADDRLVLYNEAYLGFWPQVAEQIGEPLTFEDIARIVAQNQQPAGAQVAPDRWVSDRLARHSIANGGHVQRLADGRWIQINELRTSEGGIVGIYTDITEAKAEDARARARELAEHNIMLQATLDNLSEGVCLFDGLGHLATWNDALRRLLRLPDDFMGVFETHADLLHWCRDTMGMDDQGWLDWQHQGQADQAAICSCARDNRHFELRSRVMGDGGRVFGFTDVTDMLRAQASLQETAETLDRRVSERTMELVRLNGQLEEEVAERRTIEAELTEAKIAAEKANLSKTRFLAAASHDLLQPLNAARLFVAALGDRRLALPTRALVNQTSIALDSVEELLEALLEISRLDAGAIQPEVTSFRIDRLLRKLHVEFAPMAKAAGLAFTVDAQPIWVESDQRLLRRILQNFISNALRYTSQGAVTVVCRCADGKAEISVADSGPGIAPEQQEFIFEEFRRLDTRSPGKGLGLAIVRRASDMLGHPISLHSEPGRGATFSISLPLGAEQQDEEPQGIEARDRSMRGLSVLVIDNERQIQTGMVNLLTGWGCRVVVADGFDQAAARSHDGARPDVMLVDYHLNDGETGNDVVARLRAHFSASVPAIIISADRGEALKNQLAASDIPLLNKPVKPAQLRALLRMVLA